jgi:sterol desaturase/sphingolipid hydroxylase (fatty acid hydroxylase superfamily)
MEILFDPPNLIYWAIPAFVLLLVVEAVVSTWDTFEEYDLFETKDTFASLAMGLGNVVTNLGAKAVVLGVFWLAYDYVGIFKATLVPSSAWVWVALFFAEDFSYYWFHRTAHEVRFFWASHVVHHSSEHYNLATALRQTWTGNITGSFVFWIWLPLLGFHPMMVVTVQSISLIYQFWIHTETIGRLPAPIEAVFNTPSHHRVHHSSDAKYLDRNHAGVLIIWDRLFGTFQPEEERPTYGLTTPLDSHNPFRIAFHEWGDLVRDAAQPGLTPRERLRYVFGPPGWSHDGSRLTTEDLRARAAAAHAEASPDAEAAEPRAVEAAEA